MTKKHTSLKVLTLMSVVMFLMFSSSSAFSQSSYTQRVAACYNSTTGLTYSTRGAAICNGLVGVKAPNFKAKTVTNDTFELKKKFGEIVVLNFWFIDGPSCKLEMPMLNELEAVYRNKGVNFVSVTSESQNDVMNYLSKNQFNIEVIPNNEKILREVFELNAGFGYPTTIVIDKEGVIKYIKSNGAKNQEMLAKIKQNLVSVIDELQLVNIQSAKL